MNIFSLTDVSLTLVNEPVFESVTLGIDEGEKIGLVGRNGSGKTTFLRLLQGELEPDKGSVSRNKAVTGRPRAAAGFRSRDDAKRILSVWGRPLNRACPGIRKMPACRA